MVTETKKALAEAGVDVSLLEQLAAGRHAKGERGLGFNDGKKGEKREGEVVKRSRTVILVKNLPFSVNEEEISRVFGGFGAIARIVLPETHTLALVSE